MKCYLLFTVFISGMTMLAAELAALKYQFSVSESVSLNKRQFKQLM